MEPARSSQSPNEQRPLGELAPPEVDFRLAGARERALQRVLGVALAERQERTESKARNRRDFLRTGMLGALSAGALGITLQRIVDTDSWNSTTTTSDAQVPTSQLVSQGLAFTWDNLLFQAGSHAFAALAWDHNLPVGNASLTTRALDQKESLRRALELYQKDPWLHAKAYKYIAWSAPLQEELLYRVIPSILCSGSGEEWRVGIPSSLVFAAGHNVVSPTAATKHAIPLGAHFKLSLDYVPLPQFFLGAFCWYAARRYGDLTPIVAHMLNNQAGAISLVLAGRASLRRYEQFLQEELSRSES